MKSLLLLLLLSVGIIFSINAEKYNCSVNQIVELHLNEIAFFYSNYVDDLEDFPCNITFTLITTTRIPNVTAFAAARLYNDVFTYNSYPPATLHIIQNAVNFSTMPYIIEYTRYMEGYIIFQDLGNNNCHLESISREQPFKFEDDTQVLYLSNMRDNQNTNTHPCQWNFIAPHGFGFKVVIEIFEADAFTKIRIENTTDLLINEKSVQLHHPIYNYDSGLQINLFNSNPNLKFQAAISVLKYNISKEVGNCKFTMNKNQYVWEIPGEINQECTQVIPILQKTNIMISGSGVSLGDAGDFIGYYDEFNNFIIWSMESLGFNKDIMFAPSTNGMTKNITFKYVSDGNIPGFPFSVNFEVLDCNCREELFCDAQSSIMNGNEKYCANLKCDIKIGSCPSDFLRLKMFVKLWDGRDDATTNDHFQIFANDNLVYEFQVSTFLQSVFPIILKSADNNTIKVLTLYSQIPRSLYLNPYSFEIPQITQRVILSSDNPSYVYDTFPYALILIEISEEMEAYNYAFEVHRVYDNEVYLYTDESLSTFIHETCLNVEDRLYFTCTVSNHKTFVVFGADSASSNPYLIIQLLNTKQCVFHKMTMQQDVKRSDYVFNNLTVSAISKPDMPCLVRVLLPGPYISPTDSETTLSMITKVWTTSKTEMVKLFSTRNHPLFEYNSKTQKNWKNIILFLSHIEIEIPKNSSIFIVISSIPTTSDENDLFDITSIKASEYPFNSIAITPCYGVYKRCYPATLQYFEITNYPVKFTAEYLNLPEDTVVGLRDNSTGKIVNHRFNSTGDFYIFQNQSIAFEYIFEGDDSDIDEGEWFNGAMIFVETLNNTIV